MSHLFDHPKINTLQASDFDGKGLLVNPKYRNKKVVIAFFSPGCGWCRKLEPDFIKFAEMASRGGDIIAASLDSSVYNQNTSLPMDKWPYQVSGYPTIIGYFNGMPYSKYTGDRSSSDVFSYSKAIGSKWQHY